MCKVNGDGRVRFGVKEWSGIIAIVVAVSGLSRWSTVSAVESIVNAHAQDSQRHESAEEKTNRIYRIIDREIDSKAISELSRNVAVLTQQVENLSAHLTELEQRLP